MAKFTIQNEDGDEEEENENSNEDNDNAKNFAIEIKVDEYPVFIFYNLKGKTRTSGIKCFTSEAIRFMQVINDAYKLYDLPVMKKAGIKRKNDDSFF